MKHGRPDVAALPAATQRPPGDVAPGWIWPAPADSLSWAAPALSGADLWLDRFERLPQLGKFAADGFDPTEHLCPQAGLGSRGAERPIE
jgi:hypothetical protein